MRVPVHSQAAPPSRPRHPSEPNEPSVQSNLMLAAAVPAADIDSVEVPELAVVQASGRLSPEQFPSSFYPI
jgi:hypothetical protein